MEVTIGFFINSLTLSHTFLGENVWDLLGNALGVIISVGVAITLLIMFMCHMGDELEKERKIEEDGAEYVEGDDYPDFADEIKINSVKNKKLSLPPKVMTKKELKEFRKDRKDYDEDVEERREENKEVKKKLKGERKYGQKKGNRFSRISTKAKKVSKNKNKKSKN